MKIEKLFYIWCKYQLTLNWLNILFRYFVKLLLLLNLVMIVVGVTFKFKLPISQFMYLIICVSLIDLFLKFKLQKKRQDLQALHLIPNGVTFLSILNIMKDIFSPRNLILPLLTIIIVTILGKPVPSFLYLLVISCFNNVAAGFLYRGMKTIAVLTAVVVIFITSYYNLSIISMSMFLALSYLFLIYQRYGDKLYPRDSTFNSSMINSINNISNPFLWLNFKTLKKSRHLQLTIVKAIAVCLVYCYIISTKYLHQIETNFGLILLIQVYYSLVPVLLIPYILGSNFSYIGQLMTKPDLKSFFVTNLNIIILLQFLLTLILYAANYNNVQTLFLISSICIFNVFIINPLMFMGILLTDEKIDVFDSSINSFIFTPSFNQSIYFILVLITTALFLYLLQKIGLNVFSWTLTLLGIIAFFQKEKFFLFFLSKYYKKKYKIFKILS